MNSMTISGHDSELEDSMLFEHFGTASPNWQLGVDSDALLLSSDEGAARLAVPLNAAQSSLIRDFNGVTSHAAIEIAIYGAQQKLHLVGRRIDSKTWAGTASDYTDTQSVARDLSHGLAFAEHVVSEVNSLVVVIDHNSNIKRFNRLCEELTGMREEDVVGRSAHAFMPPAEQAVSRAHVNKFFESSASYEVERSINTLKGPRKILWRNKFVQSGSGPEERYLVCSGTDVTEERLAQSRLLELVNVDTLTGLPNRHAIHERIR
ncbi:MAG: PAS domain S-box protein, partial [Janthinobacterium lividum]